MNDKAQFTIGARVYATADIKDGTLHVAFKGDYGTVEHTEPGFAPTVRFDLTDRAYGTPYVLPLKRRLKHVVVRCTLDGECINRDVEFNFDKDIESARDFRSSINAGIDHALYGAVVVKVFTLVKE